VNQTVVFTNKDAEKLKTRKRNKWSGQQTAKQGKKDKLKYSGPGCRGEFPQKKKKKRKNTTGKPTAWRGGTVKHLTKQQT